MKEIMSMVLTFTYENALEYWNSAFWINNKFIDTILVSLCLKVMFLISLFKLQDSTYFSTVADKVDLGTAPITLSFFSPFLKNSTVGMLLIPYWVAMLGQSSVLSLRHTIFPAYSFASSSITGAIILQGPHHGAQNSTRTGFSLAITRLFQFESVTTWTADFKHFHKLAVRNFLRESYLLQLKLLSVVSSRIHQLWYIEGYSIISNLTLLPKNFQALG